MASDLGLGDVVAPRGWPGAVRATLRVPAAHPLLAGHFPGEPIVPGVLLLDAVRQACERAAGRALVMVGIDDVRFTAPLLPEVSAALDAEAAVDDDGGPAGTGFVVAGTWRAAAGQLAAFRVRLAAGR